MARLDPDLVFDVGHYWRWSREEIYSATLFDLETFLVHANRQIERDNRSIERSHR